MKIMCIEKAKLPFNITDSTVAVRDDIFEILHNSDIRWIERQEAEKDAQYKQFIPYVLLKRSDGLFACYQRHGTEKRLHDKYSAGVGGHIDEPDNQKYIEV